jgi:AAA+ superfamily predicted ATPase
VATDNGDDSAPPDEATPSLGDVDLTQLSDAAFTLWENIHSTKEELKNKKRSAGKLFSNEVSDFLGVSKSDWGWSSNMFYTDNGFYLMHLLDFLDRKYTVHLQTNYKSNVESVKPTIDEHVGIRYKKFDLGRGVKHSLPHSAVFFIESEGGTEKLVLTLDSSNLWPTELTEGQIIYNCSEHQEQSFWDRFHEDFYVKGPLKGERFGADLRLLDYDPNLRTDDIILDEKVKMSLEKNIAGFIRAIPALERAGHRTSRGIMMAGVPGTGKTLYCKILLNRVDLTTIYVTRARMSKGLTLKRIYRLARKLSPSLVLIEDIDTVGGMDRRAKVDDDDDSSLGSLLEILEGIEPNTKVITVVTTNYPQHLDEALRNRPGRIDVFINIEVPNGEQRRQMLKGMTSNVKLAADIDWDELVKLTKGMSGAYLREVVASAILTFTFNSPDEDIILDNESLIDACKQSRERMEKSKVDITYDKMPELEKDDKQAWG